MALGIFNRQPKEAVAAPAAPKRDAYVPAEKLRLHPDPLIRTLELGRYGWIIDHVDAWGDHPRLEEALDAAARALDDRLALVPEGLVSLPLTIFDTPGQPEQDTHTEAFLLARHPVTNADYQRFVDGGGYEELEFWPEEIWPHLIGFKDQTNEPGPRFWRDGRHDRRLANHPVVGICYYEAAAYARWAGLRLPSEEEWQMAACWRLRSAAHTERRYPWGDSLDLERCNIWAAGHGHTLPVEACPGGAAPNGVLQLIGNVWEWTSSDFESQDREGRRVIGDTLLKGIRGGAYDTYFPWQATASFRTALSCLVRVHNVGFRCALDVPRDETATSGG